MGGNRSANLCKSIMIEINTIDGGQENCPPLGGPTFNKSQGDWNLGSDWSGGLKLI